MVVEDKLTHNERLRLECIAQAVAHNQRMSGATSEKILSDARAFEGYVKEPDGNVS